MATTDIYSVQGSLQPTRACLRFLGGNVDDGVQVDTLAAAIVAGNHTKGTITAWVMIPDYAPATQLTIFGAGDANAVEYMYFCVTTARKLQFKVYDAASTRVDVLTSGTLTPNKWHHVALVQDGTVPKIYIDAVEQTLTLTTSTELGQWFDDTDGIDGGHIGAADSVGGDAALTLEYKGYISDVRIWSGTASTAALTAAEVLDDYRGYASNTTSLLAWYTMNRTVVNVANAGTYDGTIVGDIVYCDANEFSSKLSFGCGVPVTADNIVIGIDNSSGMAFVVQQA
jgi:hypothetical protein